MSQLISTQGLWRWLLCAVAFLVPAWGPAQTPGFDWAKVYADGGLNPGGSFGGLAADAQGNIYMAGAFSGTQQFGSFTLTERDIAPGVGYDAFVAKLDSTGRVLWAVQGGGRDEDGVSGMGFDAQGNIYITGWYDGNSATFGTTTLRNTGTASPADVFVAKLSPAGQWLWVVGSNGNGRTRAHNIAVAADGTAYVLGRFGLYGRNVGSSSSFGPFTMNAVGGADMFVAKIDPNGVWQWLRPCGGNSDDFGTGLVLDKAGNAYLTGTFKSSSISFGATTLRLPPQDNIAFGDLFVAKINAAGAWQWAVAGGGSKADWGSSIAIDTARHRLYVSGWFDESAAFGRHQLTSAGDIDVLLGSLTLDGTWNWVTAGGSTAEDYGGGVLVDAAGQVYLNGVFGHLYSRPATFGSTTLLNANSNTPAGILTDDVFVAACDTLGNFQWALAAGSKGRDACTGMIRVNRSLYLTGTFEGPAASFGPWQLPANANTLYWLDTPWMAKISVRTGGSGEPVEPPAAALLPNIITPNDDGRNDTFVLSGFPAGPWSLDVYTRWGSRAYADHNYQNSWGPGVPAGNYYYRLRHAGTGQEYKGWLEVVR